MGRTAGGQGHAHDLAVRGSALRCDGADGAVPAVGRPRRRPARREGRGRGRRPGRLRHRHHVPPHLPDHRGRRRHQRRDGRLPAAGGLGGAGRDRAGRGLQPPGRRRNGRRAARRRLDPPPHNVRHPRSRAPAATAHREDGNRRDRLQATTAPPLSRDRLPRRRRRTRSRGLSIAPGRGRGVRRRAGRPPRAVRGDGRRRRGGSAARARGTGGGLVVAVGLGDAPADGRYDAEALRRAAGAAARDPGGHRAGDAGAAGPRRRRRGAVALGWLLGAYSFDAYRTSDDVKTARGPLAVRVDHGDVCRCHGRPGDGPPSSARK